MSKALRLGVSILLWASAPFLAAQPYDAALLSGLKWRMVGPFRGGRVLAVAGVSGQPNRFYFGAVGGGVWETRNAGRTWEPIFDSAAGRLDRRDRRRSLGFRACSTSEPARPTCARTSRTATACTDPDDGGRTWTHIGLEATRQIGAHRRRPPRRKPRVRGRARPCLRPESRARRVSFARRRSHLVAGSSSRTPTPARSISPSTRPTRNGSSPRSGRRAGRRGTSIRPRTVPAAALYRTEDGGDTWTPVAGGFPSEKLGRVGVAFAASDPQRVYATRRREGGWPLVLVRRRVDVEEGERRPADLGARLVLRRADRRSEGRQHDLHVRHRDVQSADGGRTFLPVKGAPGGDDYHVLLDRSGGPAAHDRRQRSGRRRSPWTAAGRGAPGTTSRPRSSTTCRPTTASPTGSTARSRTPGPRPLPRAPITPRSRCATGARSRSAARTAISRRTPRSRRSSSGAASADSTGPRFRSRTWIRRSPIRATIAASGPCRWRPRRGRRTPCISETSSSSARPTAGNTGRRSART